VTFAVLVFPTVLSKTAELERRITIKSSPAAVYAVLSDFHQFRSWDPWSVMEPESSSKVEGQGLGTIYSWEGDKVGRGNMVIKDLKENERVDVRLTFEEPFPSQADTGWTIAALDNGETEVVWFFKQELSYFQRYFGLMMDGMLGGDFESGLARLKARLEGAEA
jgi:uncharacterized protein YndB with AHSA1/START domain